MQTNTWLPIDWDAVPKDRPILVNFEKVYWLIEYYSWADQFYFQNSDDELDAEQKSFITHYMVPEAPQQ